MTVSLSEMCPPGLRKDSDRSPVRVRSTRPDPTRPDPFVGNGSSAYLRSSGPTSLAAATADDRTSEHAKSEIGRRLA